MFYGGKLSLHSFGVLVALCFFAGLRVAARNARRVGLSAAVIHDLTPSLVLGGLMGARALYVISYWDRDFAGRPVWDGLAIWKG